MSLGDKYLALDYITVIPERSSKSFIAKGTLLELQGNHFKMLHMRNEIGCDLYVTKQNMNDLKRISQREYEFLLPVGSCENKYLISNNGILQQVLELETGDSLHVEILGTGVKLGVCRYIGEMPMRKGIFIGLHFQEKCGNMDGRVNGEFLFTSSENRGMLITIDKIVKIIKQPITKEKSRIAGSTKKMAPISLNIEKKVASSHQVNSLEVKTRDEALSESVSMVADEFFNCMICLDFAEQAVDSKCCHKVFCNGCAKQCHVCPNCRESPFVITPNFVVRKVLDSLKVTCPNDGCSISLIKYKLSEHAKNCRHLLVKCPNDNCLDSVKKNEIIMHRQNCDFEWLSCPTKRCALKLQRREMKSHVKICFTRKCPSPFCGFEGFGMELCQHVINEHQEHFILNMDKLYPGL